MKQIVIFLSIVTALNLSIHYYLAKRCIQHFSFLSPPLGYTLFAIAAALLMVGPLCRQLDFENPFVQGSIFLSYYWMGLVWLLLVATLSMDLVQGVLFILNKFKLNFSINLKPIQIGLWGLALLASFYGMYQALRTPPIREYELAIQNLPREFDGYRILQLSDTHIGPILGKKWTQSLVNQIQSYPQKVNLIVHTGDLIDGTVTQLGSTIQIFKSLQAPDGVLYVTGNHEAYSGVVPWTDFLTQMGWKVLINEHTLIKRGFAQICLGGITDAKEEMFVPARKSNPQKAFANAPDTQSTPRILLAHQPKSALLSQGLGIQVQLSGHTHGGQIWPFGLLVYLQQPMNIGFKQIGDILVYTTPGAGFWGPPMRIGANPEIPIFTLKRKN